MAASLQKRPLKKAPRVSPKVHLSAMDCLVSLDTETTGLDLRHGCKPFMITACTPKGEVKIWEWAIDPLSRRPKIPPSDKREVAAYFRNKIIVFHNGGFDLRALSEIGFEFQFAFEDLPPEGSHPGKMGYYSEEYEGWIVKAAPRFYKTSRMRRQIVRVIAQKYHDTQLMAHACSSGDEYQRLKGLAIRHLRFPDDDEKELGRAVGVASRFCKSRKIDVKLGYSLKKVKHPKTGELVPARETKYDYWLPRFVYDWIVKNECGGKESKVPENFLFLKDVCRTYGRKDAERTILLCLFYFELMKEIGVTSQYEKERNLLRTVYRMETNGIPFDNGSAAKKMKSLKLRHKKYHDAAFEFGSKKLKRPMNLGSWPDMRELLYKKLKLPEQTKVKKTKTGERETVVTSDKKALEKLLESTSRPKSPNYSKATSEFLKNVIISRSYLKGIEALQSYTYYALPLKNYDNISLLYPSLNQSGTTTTRFSSNRPNGQNVSKIATIDVAGLELEGPRMRDIFVPPPGKIWYASDYSQLELRIFAFVSQEKSLIEALAKGYDFHEYVATRIFNLKPGQKPTKQQRRIAKNTNFSIIFGASPWKVDMTAGISGAYDQFAGLFPNVASFMKEMIGRARQDGYVLTVDGYRLDIPRQEPYKIVSFLVQGTAGRIIKNAMMSIDRKRLIDWKDSRIALQIHDELLNEFTIHDPDNRSEHASQVFAINQEMEKAGADLGIYTPVSTERIDSDWGNGQEVVVSSSRIKHAPKKKKKDAA
jgi:DNA polymerase I-like protein with 3'-5' exonuclease and polymerase domains